MGNTQQQSYQNRFQSKYAFNQIVDDPNFGHIKIYRKKQLNFDYVMILQKYVNNQQLPTLTQEISKIHTAFLGEDQPMTLRIFNYEVIQEKWSECKLPLIRLYIEYFNFTLFDLIEKHKEKNEGFTYEETIYILSSILDTFEFFEKINPSYFSISRMSIYLTPEGWIKFSPVKVRDFFQEPNAFCKAIIYQTKDKQIVNEERTKKSLLAEIKKLLLIITNLQLRPDLISLYERVDKINTLEGLRKMIGKPTLEGLILTKNGGETTESLDSYNHESKATQETRVKKSMKKLSLERHK